MKKSKKALLWTIVPVLGVSSGVAGAVAGVTNQKTSVDTNNVATSSTATTMATRSTSNFKVTDQTREVLAYSGLSPTETLFVVVTGAPKYGILNYKWEVNKGSGWETHTSTNRSSISVDISDRFTTIQNWTFRCTISDTKSNAKVTSEDIKFTIVPKLGRSISILTQPAATTTVNGGERVTLSTLAEGIDSLKGREIGYQWFEYDSNEDKFTEIVDGTDSVYTFVAPSNTKASTIKKYVCRYYVKGSDGTKTYLSESNQSIVTINKDVKEVIKITSITEDQKVKVGGKVTLSATAESTKTKDLKYQWYKSSAYGTPYEPINGAGSAVYEYEVTEKDEGKELLFCVLVTGTMQDNIINHFQSGNVKVKVLSSDGASGTTANETFASKLSVTSSITTNQASVKPTFYPVGGMVRTPEYTVSVKGGSKLSYKWYYVSGNGKTKNLIASATSSTLKTNKDLYEKAYKDNSKHKVGIVCEIYDNDVLVQTVDEKTDSRFYMTVVIARR